MDNQGEKRDKKTPSDNNQSENQQKEMPSMENQNQGEEKRAPEKQSSIVMPDPDITGPITKLADLLDVYKFYIDIFKVGITTLIPLFAMEKILIDLAMFRKINDTFVDHPYYERMLGTNDTLQSMYQNMKNRNIERGWIGIPAPENWVERVLKGELVDFYKK